MTFAPPLSVRRPTPLLSRPPQLAVLAGCGCLLFGCPGMAPQPELFAVALLAALGLAALRSSKARPPFLFARSAHTASSQLEWASLTPPRTARVTISPRRRRTPSPSRGAGGGPSPPGRRRQAEMGTGAAIDTPAASRLDVISQTSLLIVLSLWRVWVRHAGQCWDVWERYTVPAVPLTFEKCPWQRACGE